MTIFCIVFCVTEKVCTDVDSYRFYGRRSEFDQYRRVPGKPKTTQTAVGKSGLWNGNKPSISSFTNECHLNCYQNGFR